MKTLRTLFINSVIALLLTGKAQGQYALDETGVMMGAGSGILSGQGEIHAGVALNASFFYSHYVCGKNWGYHFEGGYHALFSRVYGLYTPTELPIDPLPALSVHMAEIGVYAKVRPHTYHREKEICLLAGPLLNIAPFYSVSGGLQGLFEAREGRVNPLRPGLHLSLMWRFPVGDEKSLFIRPGAQMYAGKLYEVNGNTSFGAYWSHAYAFLQLGYTLWRSR